MKRLALVAITAVAAVTGTLLVQWTFEVYPCSKKNPSAKPRLSGKPQSKFSNDTPAEIVDEQLARTRAFLGQPGIDSVRDSYIVIVGAGGVGSWAATMLVRSGVGKIRLVDFDQVTLSSLNRHACATLQDVGTPKVHCIQKFLHMVAPWVEVEPVVELWTKDTGSQLLGSSGRWDRPSFVLDCIDNINTKVDLIEFCATNGLPLISAMGAGAKADPTRVQIADISMTIEDPLSRATRIRLRHRGISSGVPVVFSTEKPGKVQLLELEDSVVEQGPIDELSVLRDFRVRILPVLGPLPAIFGLVMATHVLTTLAGHDSVRDPLQGGYSLTRKNRPKLYEHALQGLVGQIARLNWPCSKAPMTTVDAEYLVEDVFRGKSVVSGEGARLVLSIWDPLEPVQGLENVVVLTKDQQRQHEETVLKPKVRPCTVYSAHVMKTVDERIADGRWLRQFR